MLLLHRLDRGRHYEYGWAMDALCSGRNRPRKSLCLRRGCPRLGTDQTRHVIMVAPWMLSSQSGLDHGGHCGCTMDVLFPERFRLSLDHRRHDWAMDALFSDGVWMLSSESKSNRESQARLNKSEIKASETEKHRQHRAKTAVPA